jgi:hypothetical protein
MKSAPWISYLFVLGSMSVQAQVLSDPEQKLRLVEQKLKLVEMLVNSPAAQATSVGREADTPALFERSQEMIRQARVAISAQRYDDARRVLDEALRNVSKPSGELGLAESIQKRHLQDFADQLAVYRPALVEMTKDPRIGSAATKLQTRIAILTDEARQLADAGRLGDANKKMAEAYKLAVEEISRLRAGQEVIMALKFDSPIEEFIYEQKRFQSNEILLSMMISEGRATSDNRKQLEVFLGQASTFRDQAGDLAHHNNHKSAVTVMEQANSQLNRALQLLGVPVF